MVEESQNAASEGEWVFVAHEDVRNLDAAPANVAPVTMVAAFSPCMSTEFRLHIGLFDQATLANDAAALRSLRAECSNIYCWDLVQGLVKLGHVDILNWCYEVRPAAFVNICRMESAISASRAWKCCTTTP
jgi:hypothetical protein